MKATFVFAYTQLKRYTRDPMALFFTLLFPLLFLFVFGSIFKGSDAVSFDVAYFNQSDTVFAKKFAEQIKTQDTFTVKEVASLDEAKEKMGRGELDSILVAPKDFGRLNGQHQPNGNLEVYYEESSPQTGQTIASVMTTVLSDISQSITKTKPLFAVSQKATKTSNLSQFDFTFSGLLAFTFLSLGVFGLAQQLPSEKKKGTLRRLRSTPFTKPQLIFGTMIYYGAMGALSLILMIIVGLVVFHFDMRGDWLQLALFSIPSLAVMLGFGLLIGGISRNENQAAVFTNLVAFPMMFLSGTFFPRYLMPDWLQGITNFLPMSPITDGIRMITTEGATLLALGPQLAMIGAWLVVVYAFAIRFFRWE